jgi:homospermidine synthase
MLDLKMKIFSINFEVGLQEDAEEAIITLILKISSLYLMTFLEVWEEALNEAEVKILTRAKINHKI